MDAFGRPYLEGFSAGVWGGNPGWLPQIRSSPPENIKHTRTLLATLRMYDVWIWPAYCNWTVKTRFEAIDRKFGIAAPDCRFVGYWQAEAQAITGLPADVQASFYVRPGKGALIYVSNFNAKKQAVACRVDFKKWDLGDFKVVDAETGKELALTAGTLNLEIEGHDFRVIRLENK